MQFECRTASDLPVQCFQRRLQVAGAGLQEVLDGLRVGFCGLGQQWENNEPDALEFNGRAGIGFLFFGGQQDVVTNAADQRNDQEDGEIKPGIGTLQ